MRGFLCDWNDTGREIPPATLPELFAGQAAQTPDAVALVFNDESLTYAELDARTNQLAHHLRALGVGPEVVVGLCVERSLEMLIGLLGILKAGGAYLPLDPSCPHERLAFMLQDAGARVLVGQAVLLAHLPADAARIVCFDADRPTIAQQRPPPRQASSTRKILPTSSTRQDPRESQRELWSLTIMW